MSIYLLFLLRCSNGVHFRAIALSKGEKIHLINRKSITEAVATMRSVAQDTFTDGRGRFSGNGRGVETSESQCFSFFQSSSFSSYSFLSFKW